MLWAGAEPSVLGSRYRAPTMLRRGTSMAFMRLVALAAVATSTCMRLEIASVDRTRRTRNLITRASGEQPQPAACSADRHVQRGRDAACPVPVLVPGGQLSAQAGIGPAGPGEATSRRTPTVGPITAAATQVIRRRWSSQPSGPASDLRPGSGAGCSVSCTCLPPAGSLG